MKIDIYTRVILTAIAIGLLWIGVNTTGTVSAENRIVDVNIVQLDGNRIYHADPLPVYIVKGKWK